MKIYAYYNGEFDQIEKIKIPLSDRSIYFGDCIYDAAIGCYDRILWEEDHIDRFLNNADRLGIKHSYSKKYISSLLREIAIKSGIEEYFIYFSLSRNLRERTHSAAESNEANLLVTIEDFKIADNSTPMKLMLTEDRRYEYCDLKTTNLLPAVIAQTEAESKGFDESVFHRNGIVTECAKSNISIIKCGSLITHPKSCRILPGITREHLLKLCMSIGVEINETPFTVQDMFSADEILVSSTSKLVRRADTINGIKVGGHNTKLADSICSNLYYEFVRTCRLVQK